MAGVAAAAGGASLVSGAACDLVPQRVLRCGELLLRALSFLPLCSLARALVCASAWWRQEGDAFREVARLLGISSCTPPTGCPVAGWRDAVRESLRLSWETLRVPYTGPAAEPADADGPWWGRWVPLHGQPGGTSFPTLEVSADGSTVRTGDADEDIYVAGRAFPLRGRESSWDLVLRRADDDVVDAVGVAFFGAPGGCRGGSTSQSVLKTAVVWNSDGEHYHSFPLQVAIGAERDCSEVDFGATFANDERLRIRLRRCDCAGGLEVALASVGRAQGDEAREPWEQTRILSNHSLVGDSSWSFRPLVRMYGSSSATFVSGTLRWH